MIPHDWVGNWLWNKRHLTDFRMAQLIMWALLACCLDILIKSNMHTSDTWTTPWSSIKLQMKKSWRKNTRPAGRWWNCGSPQMEDWIQKTEKLMGPPDHTFYTKWIYWGFLCCVDSWCQITEENRVSLQVGVDISVQRFAMRSVRTGGHSCAYIVQMMPCNIVMRLLTGCF